MADVEQLEALFNKHGYGDYRWIDPQDIVVSQWVRMKCMFGCGDYGGNASCPPYVPSVSESRQFIDDYKTVAIFHFAKAVKKPEDRFSWTREINQGLVALERDIFLFGYYKAFVLVIDNCTLCEECKGIRDKCEHRKTIRPAPEAMAIDVYSTVLRYDYPIQVLIDYTQTMNRYAFLFIE